MSQILKDTVITKKFQIIKRENDQDRVYEQIKPKQPINYFFLS